VPARACIWDVDSILVGVTKYSTFLSSDGIDVKEQNSVDITSSMDAADVVAMDIGLAFVKATKPDPLPPGEQFASCLEFVDAVLTLTSSVMSVPLVLLL
jgi:hypothetical protein